MKKPHIEASLMTDESIIVQCCGPVSQLKNIQTTLKTHGFQIISKSALKEDRIPWRNAFPELEDQNIPAVCLKAARVREELTQQKLAEKSGIKQNHISEMENGKRTIGIESAKKLAAVLNTDYRVFL